VIRHEAEYVKTNLDLYGDIFVQFNLIDNLPLFKGKKIHFQQIYPKLNCLPAPPVLQTMRRCGAGGRGKV
jgi:hypothetical protein